MKEFFDGAEVAYCLLPRTFAFNWTMDYPRQYEFT